MDLDENTAVLSNEDVETGNTDENTSLNDDTSSETCLPTCSSEVLMTDALSEIENGNYRPLLMKILGCEPKSSSQYEILDYFMSIDAHSGHQASRWNPKMSKYIFGMMNKIHILNLSTTIFLLKKVLQDLIKIFSIKNAKILFIGSKAQVVSVIKDQATRCNQFYVNHRWFGGTLTNWVTIQKSLKKLQQTEDELQDEFLIKKIRQHKQRIIDKLENSLGGVRGMSNLPDLIFVVDTNREKIAIKEANKLGIPVISLVDTNSDPSGISYPIPCNDDSRPTVQTVAALIAEAIVIGRETYAANRKNLRDREVNLSTEGSENPDQQGERRNFKPRKRDYLQTDQKIHLIKKTAGGKKLNDVPQKDFTPKEGGSIENKENKEVQS